MYLECNLNTHFVGLNKIFFESGEKRNMCAKYLHSLPFPLLCWNDFLLVQFSYSVLSDALWPFATWTVAHQASLFFTSSQSLLKLMSIKSVMPSSHLILCHPLLLLPSIFPSIRVFSSESFLHIRWPKYLNFSFSISPSNVYSGLISFKIERIDVFAVQGTFKSLLQHHSLKASILWRVNELTFCVFF